MPGLMAIEDDLPWGKQEIIMQLTPAGRAMGFTTEMVARQVRNSFEGAIAKRFARDEEEVIVRVLLPKETNRSNTLRDLYLLTPGQVIFNSQQARHVAQSFTHLHSRRFQHTKLGT
jgi:hypothetical protein